MLQINHTETGTEIFNANPLTMVQTGYGNVDYAPSKIMVGGDVLHPPKVISWSEENKEGGCPNVTKSFADGQASLNFEGTLDAPVKVWFLFDKYVRTSYQIQVLLPESDDWVQISASIDDKENLFNFVSMNYNSEADEEIYGLGLQYSVWNFKGRKVPIFSAEGGIGRGLQPLTWIVDLINNLGGNTLSSYAPSYSHITSKDRAFIFNTTALGYLDFSYPDGKTRAVFWHSKSVDLQLTYGANPKNLSSAISRKVGTMRPLPEWTFNGAVVGLQGGEGVIKERYAYLKNHSVPMAALWMQDWVGLESFREGDRLLWNWQLNEQYYPNWGSMV